jgi:hypothetical protein
MPSMAQHETTIPVEVFVVQSDANGLFHNTIHIAQRSVHWHQTEQQKLHAWHPVVKMLSNQEAGLMQQALDTSQQLPLASARS